MYVPSLVELCVQQEVVRDIYYISRWGYKISGLPSEIWDKMRYYIADFGVKNNFSCYLCGKGGIKYVTHSGVVGVCQKCWPKADIITVNGNLAEWMVLISGHRCQRLKDGKRFCGKYYC